MGTRSTIALEFADGSVAQVYCHWDGYLKHNGKILMDHYTDPFKLRDLIDQGDLSSLAAEIGVKHPFDNPHRFDTPEWLEHRKQYGNMCKFYGRDRGEKNIKARYFKDFADYKVNAQFEEYDYILRQVNGEAVWYVSDHGNQYEPLMEVYIEVLRQEAMEEEVTE